MFCTCWAAERVLAWEWKCSGISHICCSQRRVRRLGSELHIHTGKVYKVFILKLVIITPSLSVLQRKAFTIIIYLNLYLCVCVCVYVCVCVWVCVCAHAHVCMKIIYLELELGDFSLTPRCSFCQNKWVIVLLAVTAQSSESKRPFITM